MEARKQTLYLRVTRDKYELPIAVATSRTELAMMLGVPKISVYRGFETKGKGYIKLEVELEEGEIL